MPDLGEHALFIVSAYIGAGVVIAALVGWVAWQSASVKRRLAALEAAGIRRRSDGAAR